MGSRVAPQTHDLYEGGVRNVSVDFSPLLDAGENLSGSPTITNAAANPATLSISNEQISSTELTINGVAVPAARAVLFRVTRGAAAEGQYDIDILVSTTGGQTLPGTVRINCA